MIQLPYITLESKGIHLIISNPQINAILRRILLVDLDSADAYLTVVLIALISLCFKQLHAFTRPPPVQRKHLPQRPALQILFKPDEISFSSTVEQQQCGRNHEFVGENGADTTLLDSSASSVPSVVVSDMPPAEDDDLLSQSTRGGSFVTTETSKPKKPIIRPYDLPDSFAPLLSSSQMEILYDELSTDLLHAMQVEGVIRLRHGRHNIPLDKDSSRPQLVLDIPSGGCKVTAVSAIGSDGFSTEDDLDPFKLTKDRSLPMVKHAGVTLDPPLPLANVAPTLIHFPTLFEDNVVKYTLRRIQIVRYALDMLKSISSFIEKVLWIIESKCQIHLGKISVTPLYRGAEYYGKDKAYREPQWRLSLAFSGHLMLFGWIPIPFVNIVLPTWIIPSPHALLEYLVSSQPLASAKVKREEISFEEITLAVINAVETWDFKVEAVGTPPALGVDLKLPGGITVAVETMHGTDVSGGRPRGGLETSGHGLVESHSNSDTLSSCTMFSDNDNSRTRFRRHRTRPVFKQMANTVFDANKLVPWKGSVHIKGKMSNECISVVIPSITFFHSQRSREGGGFGEEKLETSKISISGNIVVCLPDALALQKADLHSNARRKVSSSRLHNLAFDAEKRTVAAILLFPEKNTSSNRRYQNLLKYEYQLDIGEDTTIDAVSLSIGATHPMLKGGTIITTILESMYAYGTVSSRQDSLLDMSEFSRKRNILRHLPAVDFTAGINNFFIPEESMSLSDDGQTKCTPELLGGQILMRVLGGFNKSEKYNEMQHLDSLSSHHYVEEGIKVILDVGIASLALNNKTNVNEFPELDIFEGQKLLSTLSGSIDGTVFLHLRPQNLESFNSGTVSKNIFNPLEAYEIDFTGSKVGLKITEAKAELGHRRLIIPSETTVGLHIVKSVVDMAFDGTTECELNWDFQGSSPILQSTSVGLSPEIASHEDKEQVNLLIYPLRQGRFNLVVSPVGGLTITQAVTTRENKVGLYDWKFFNAIVSPNDESVGHIMKVLHDKRTMNKLLQVVGLINRDLEKLGRYLLKQVWRAKDIFDREGVSGPGHAIPGHKMARLLSLFLCGDANQLDEILPIVRRVVAGDGLDVIKTKDLLRKNLSIYEDYAPEIDRATRWAEVMLGSIEAPKPFEEKLPPLSLDPIFRRLFDDFPSADEIYRTLLEKRHLPLDSSFSAMVSTLAPYMSFPQVEYILQSRPSKDWQAADLRRLRYVYSVKKKVFEISESYGGLSFMPQSFFVSVFVGEATRASLRARGTFRRDDKDSLKPTDSWQTDKISNETALYSLRKSRQASSNENLQRLSPLPEHKGPGLANLLSPAARIASSTNIVKDGNATPRDHSSNTSFRRESKNYFNEVFDVGDSLLGPEDVAILLQAGLTSAMRGSTVVQLNQRMLLDLMASQPRQFSLAVLCEIGSPGGQGNPRGLTSALMALLDLDQSSFKEFHRLNIHKLLESWLPDLKIPRREDYLAGGRWASRSYYDAIYNVAENILEEAKIYTAFKGYVQRVRHNEETDPVPTAKEIEFQQSVDKNSSEDFAQLEKAVKSAKMAIEKADLQGQKALNILRECNTIISECEESLLAIELYNASFEACKNVLKLDKLAFHAEWFKRFYRRNYDALMVKSVYDNIIEDTDEVREWMSRLYRATVSKTSALTKGESAESTDDEGPWESLVDFKNPKKHMEQDLIDAVIELLFYDKAEKSSIANDPLVRLLISNPDGNYDFTIVSAMGVITEGKKGVELEPALRRLKERRNIITVRADTGTARSLEYNAVQIQKAVDEAMQLKKPYGILGYSQGCPNALMAESMLLSGPPSQQEKLISNGCHLACRQLLFSAANGSMHGPATEAKIHRLIVMCESFFKYQQGYCSRAFTSLVLDILTGLMDSAPFQKFVAGGGGTFLHRGSRAFWREAQHLPTIPTCVLRGVLEDHTTPESLEMISNLLTKAAGSNHHDSQVHVYDAVGRPVYTKNRNARVLECCEMGGAIQRTHHWSPLNEEVKFVSTQKDAEYGTFMCAKDRHVFPWVDVNARFGFIKYEEVASQSESTTK